MGRRPLCEHRGVSPSGSDSMQHPAFRIGDAERDECVEALTEHHVRGRLSAEELDRRQGAALTALTAADLAALLVDLPRDPSDGAPVLVGDARWSSAAKLRDMRIARWAAAPLSLAAGGVLVASANPINDETGFAVGCAAAALGFATHVVINRWPRSRSDQGG